MPKIEVTTPRRWWRPWRQVYRRDLPASWTEVEPARRLPLLRLLFRYPGAMGRLLVLRRVLCLPNRIFKAIDDDQVTGLLSITAGWMTIQESPEPVLAWFDDGPVRYHAPRSHGLNLVALEYPIADEAFGNYLRTGDKAALRLLCATLYREANPDTDAATTRGDIRVPLRSRWEAEARAERLAAVPEEVLSAVLLYFAGVKQYVSKAYGAALFEQPELDEHGNPVPAATTPSLGWWTVYFNLATDGPFGRNVEEVYQTAFHDVCLFLVDRKRQEDRIRVQQRMSEKDFGIKNE